MNVEATREFVIVVVAPTNAARDPSGNEVRAFVQTLR